MIRTVTWDRDLDILVMKSLFGHLCGCLFLNEGEERLAVDLVCSDKVDDKGEIKEEQRERKREERVQRGGERERKEKECGSHNAISIFKHHMCHINIQVSYIS